MSDKPTPPPPPEHIPAAPRAVEPELEPGVPPVPLPGVGGGAATPSPYGPDTTAPPVPVAAPAPAPAPAQAQPKAPAPVTAPIPIPEPYFTDTPAPRSSNAGRWIIAVIATIAIGAIVGVGALAVNLVRPSGPAPVTVGEGDDPAPAPVSPDAPDTQAGDIPGSIVYTGSGDKKFEITLPDGPGVLAVADMTHSGAGGFWVTGYNSDNGTIGGLVSANGPYDGTVMLNSLFDEDTASLEVLADGAWSVTVRSIDTVETLDGPYSGDHDTVFKYEGPGGTASSTHGGESNFIIWSFGEPRKQLVENEIGVFSGTAEFQPGPTYVAVVADGPWTLEIK